MIDFQEKLDPAAQPVTIEYDEVLELLQDLIELPRRFHHLIESDSSVRFQGILVFGPPDSGRILMAQNPAAQQELAFFKIPVEKPISISHGLVISDANF